MYLMIQFDVYEASWVLFLRWIIPSLHNDVCHTNIDAGTKCTYQSPLLVNLMVVITYFKDDLPKKFINLSQKMYFS